MQEHPLPGLREWERQQEGPQVSDPVLLRDVRRKL